MPNLYGAPEISVYEVAARLESVEDFLILDVREEWEIELAGLEDGRVQVTPLSLLAEKGLGALPESAGDRGAEIVVICHHGVRSAEVTAWLIRHGWTNVRSMTGGLEEYAEYVDESVGQY